ncbi:MAG: methyltransferase domain-containing protein, partial [Parachlamydiaceae bacterium]
MNISPVRGTPLIFERSGIDDAIQQLLAGENDRLAMELQIQKSLNCLERPSSGLLTRLREAGYLITYNPETIVRFKSFYLRGNPELTQAIQSATEKGGLLADGFKMYRPGPASCSHLNGAAKGYDEIFALFETHTNEKERIGKDTLHFLHLLEKHLPVDHPWKAVRKVIDLACGNGVQTEKICMPGWEVVGIDNQAGCIEKCQNLLTQQQFVVHDILQTAPLFLTKTAAVVFVSHFYCSPAQATSFVQNLKDYQASDNSLVIFVNGCEGTDADELCHKLPFLRGKPSPQMSEEFQKALNQFGYNSINFVREAKVFFPPLTREIEETLLTIQRGDYENPYLGMDENTKVFKGLMEFIASFPLEAMTTEQISAYLEALKVTFAKNHGTFLKICNKMVIAHSKKADAAFKIAFEQAQIEEASGYELELIDEKVAQGFFKEAKDMLSRRIQKTKENALFVRLGEICLQEGQYPEAAAIFWYAKRLELQMDAKIEQVEKELLSKHSSQVGEYRGLEQAHLDREKLQAFRQKINEEYQAIASQPFGLEKAESLRTIYSQVTQGIKAFIADLSEDVIRQLETWGHSLPCEYAIIGLGSLAREEMTPYSDFEFAILVASEEKAVKDYFRLFTYLLHLRIINLGETILPAVDMSALNWLYDDLTPRGLSFDGSMPTACKTPLGKQKGQLGDFELIHTPTKMSELQQIQENDPLKRLWVLKRYHLPTILSASTYIVGSEQGDALVEEYQAQVRTFLFLGEGKKRTLDLMEDDLSRFKPQLTGQENGKHYNVKKDLYRLPNTMFDGLANYFNLVSTSTWERIEELEKRGLLCSDGANNLKLLTMGAQELRLATYL